MGRPKTYQRDDVLHRAMEQFWLTGFDGTSTTELATAMGINRSTMYTEFGTKQQLYQAALDRYLSVVVPTFIAEILAPDADLMAIEAVFDRFGQAAGGPGTERGCMACNAATERAQCDPTARDVVARYVSTLETAFHRALIHAVAQGQVNAAIDARAWARALTTTLMGLFVLIRAQLPGTVARETARLTMANLRAQAP